MLPLIGAAAGLITGGIEAYMGYKAKKNAQNQISNQQRPVWQASPYENDMLRLSESQAGQGMTDPARQAYLNQAQGGLGATLGAIQRSGGSPNGISAAYGNYNKGVENLGIYDDQARQNNLNRLMTSYARQSALSDKDFQFNKYAPYTDKMAALNQQLAGATNMMQSGIDTAVGGLTGGLFSLGNQASTNAVMPQAQQQQPSGIGESMSGSSAMGGMPSYDPMGGSSMNNAWNMGGGGSPYGAPSPTYGIPSSAGEGGACSTAPPANTWGYSVQPNIWN